MMVYHKFQSLIGNVQHIITANNNTHFVFQSLIGNVQLVMKYKIKVREDRFNPL